MATEETEDQFEEREGGREICGVYIPPPPKPSGIQDGRRLVITKIVIEDFKSYGRCQVLGPFHKSFTSIVGPNGSGKSNVIDAMLFVFGYRAQKLRLKKLSLLIHNSDTYPNCTSCTVTVHFALIYDKLEEEMDIIEGSEFTISRTAHKDNSSFYSLNGKRVQFRDVHNRLQSHGIDLQYNRFLILQGEVEQISLMKPKADGDNDAGMLEFLEDIIGTSRLKVPLEKINARVNELNELRAEKINRCKLVQRERDALEDVRNEAIKFLKLENKLMKLQELLYTKHMQSAKDTFEEAQAELNSASEDLEKALKEVNMLKEMQAEKQKTYEEVNKEFSEINSKLEGADEKVRVLEREIQQNRCKTSNTKEKGKKLVCDKGAAEELLKETQSEIEKLDDKIAKERTNLQELEDLYKEAGEQLNALRGTIEQDVKPLREEKERHEAKLLSLQTNVNQAKSELELKKSALDQYLLVEKQEKSKLLGLESELKSNMARLAERQQLISQVECDLPASEKRIIEGRKRLSEIQTESKTIEAKRVSLMSTLSEARKNSQARGSRDRVMSALSSSGIPEIYGRVGDLATIDKKYSVALSNASRPSFDKILVDTLDTARKCIEYLKANNVGRAVFLALKEQRKWHHADFDFDHPAERLIDLIDIVDEKFSPAFSAILRDTLVCDNLDIAMKIAFGPRRWRVVTLCGKIIEPSGVMVGGSNRRTSMGPEISADQLAKMERDVSSYEQKLASLQVEHEKLERDIEQAVRDNEIIRLNIPKYQMEIKEVATTITSLEKAIEESKIRLESVKPDPKKVAKLEEDIEDLQKTYDSIKQDSKVFEDKIESINSEIEELIRKTTGPCERKVSQLKKDIEAAEFTISKAEAGRNTACRSVEKCQDKIRQYEEEITQSKELIGQLKERRQQIRDELDGMTAKQQGLRTRHDEVAARVKQLSIELAKLKDDESKFESSNLDIKHKAELLAKKVDEKQLDVAKWAQMIDNLEYNRLEGVDLMEGIEEDMDQLDVNRLNKIIEAVDKDIKKLKPNVAAIDEYRQKQQLYIERTEELNVVTRQRDEFREAYESVKTQRLTEFKDGFAVINRKLKEMYRMITLGGDAELEYCDSLDPFLEGITFSVRPNKKTWKQISNLSGGEKTLSSLSLIFALHYYKPSPLYVMDEIDAALDFKNVSIVGHYIKERTKNTQFLVISLRNNMYELSNRLIGIYKTHNSTKTCALSLVKTAG